MNTEPQKPDLIRIKDAAKMLQVSPATIRNMIDRGKFPGAVKIDPSRRNSPYRIPRQEILKAIAEQLSDRSALANAAAKAAGIKAITEK